MGERTRMDLSQLPDGVLVDLVVDGDADAFAHLARRYGGQMRAMALRYTGNSADADDVVQEALVSAWEKMYTLRDGDAVRAWLVRLAARKAIDLVRGRKDHVELTPQSQGNNCPETRALTRAGIADLEAALAQIPPIQAQAWLLHHGSEMSYFEIAAQLGVSVATVRGRIARARQSLLEQMEGWR